MKDEAYSEVPKPPTGIGISRRLLLTIVIGLLVIVILFLYFLNRYAPQPIKNLSNETHPSSSESAISLIEKIQGQTYQPLLVNSKTNHSSQSKSTKDEDDLINETIKKNLSENDFKEASNAPISVYHRNVQSTESPAALSYHPPVAKQENINLANLHPPDAYAQQNLQSEKIAFLKNNDSLNKNTMTSHLQAPLSPYQLNAGTIIPANLVTGIHSNLPGMITARVRRDVYDTATGNYLLIPQGTTLIGRYDSQYKYSTDTQDSAGYRF